MFTFPKRISGPDILSHIFPSKQKAALKAIELAEQDERINRVIVFGSAVTASCGALSDIDVAIDASCPDEESFIRLAG